ncbi:MAG: ABC transporter ATP-binding protein [Geminicoccaceae bacterium]|nr:MAG: ABC transporter ATP-binding protein [Geminicoccaceae bacterium]
MALALAHRMAPQAASDERGRAAGAMLRSVPHGSLVVHRLSHWIDGRAVLDDVSFEVGAGEVHALVGPSGCGKSTTLRLVAGLEPVQSGSIAICGQTVAEPGVYVPPERRNVGLMFQDYALFPHLTVRGNVAFGLSRMAKRERDATVERWLSRVDLRGYGERYPHQLSGGEQQRVALARAMAPGPCLMLLDEAFSSLDTHLREELRELVVQLLRETGTPTVLVTHDADEAVRVADRMHVMRAGRLIQSGTPSAVYAHPKDLFVCGFFGAASRFKSWVVGGRVSTPLGDVQRPDLADGTGVDVVVRPDAASLAPGGDGPRGTIVRLRDLGPHHLADIAVGGGWIISAKVPHSVVVPVGAEVALDVDEDHILVFEGG